MTDTIKLGSPEFKALQREWYRKLRETGHQDIELGRDAPDTLMMQHHVSDRRTVVRGQRTGEDQRMSALAELRNYAVHTSLFQRIVTGLMVQGMTKKTIVAGMANQRHATSGAVHRAQENARLAAERLAVKGDHIPPADEEP